MRVRKVLAAVSVLALAMSPIMLAGTAAAADGILTITAPTDGSTIAYPLGDGGLVFEGTGQTSGVGVDVMDGDATLCSASADDFTDGSWTCSYSGDGEGLGPHTVAAHDAGYPYGASASIGFTLVSPPDAPGIDGLEGDTLTVPNGTTSYTLAGSSTSSDGTVEVVMDEDTKCATAPISGGAWSCDITSGLDEGEHTVDVYVTDANGLGSPSTRFTLVVAAAPPPTTPPNSPNFEDGDQSIDIGPEVSLPVHGNVPGASDGTVNVTIDGEDLQCTRSVSSAGDFDCSIDVSTLSAGDYTVRAVYLDSSDNQSDASTFTLHMVDPEAGGGDNGEPTLDCSFTPGGVDISGTDSWVEYYSAYDAAAQGEGEGEGSGQSIGDVNRGHCSGDGATPPDLIGYGGEIGTRCNLGTGDTDCPLADLEPGLYDVYYGHNESLNYDYFFRVPEAPTLEWTPSSDSTGFSGTGTVGDHVKVVDDVDSVVCEADVDGAGKWECSLDGSPGTSSYRAYDVDAESGGISPYSDPVSAPALTLDSPDGSSIVTADSVEVTGRTSVGANIHVEARTATTDAFVGSCDTSADDGGGYDCPVPVKTKQSIVITVTDGIQAPVSTTISAVAAPEIDDVTYSGDTGTLTSFTQSSTVTGVAWADGTAGTTVSCTIYNSDHNLVGSPVQVLADVDTGVYECPIDVLDNGTYYLTVTQHPYWAEQEGADVFSDEQSDLHLVVDAESRDRVVTSPSELQDALAYAGIQTIELGADVDATGSILAIPSSVTLDLRNYTLTTNTIRLGAGITFTITDTDEVGHLTDDGHLTATGSTGDLAGIETTDATLAIEAGTISATSGSDYGAGIGGDARTSNARNAGTVTISGGVVTAVGRNLGAGIGGGFYQGTGGDGGTVTITGGTVTASSNSYGAGIGGGGYHGTGGTVVISGGTVDAHGGPDNSSGYGGAGIGGGFYGAGGSTTIDGGTVTATGGANGAGIGGGNLGAGGATSVSAGTVTATGGSHADGKITWGAGIGSGADNSGEGSETTLTGGIVTTSSGEDASAVGNGSGSSSDYTLTVDGHLVLGTALHVAADSTVEISGLVSGEGAVDGAGSVTNDGAIQNTDVTADVTHHNYLVSFDGNGNGASVDPETVRVYAANFTDGAREFPTATRPGHELVRWRDADGDPVSLSSAISTETLAAEWETVTDLSFAIDAPAAGGTSFAVRPGAGLVVSGTGTHAASVNVRVDDASIDECSSVIVDATGHWTCTIPDATLKQLGVGSHQILAESDDSTITDYTLEIPSSVVVTSASELASALDWSQIDTITIGHDITVTDAQLAIPRDLTIDLGTHTVTAKSLKAAEGSTLTIDGTTGALDATADSGSNNAGLEINSAAVRIEGGTITATGDGFGAGIGAGTSPFSTGGVVAITGGRVNAQGGEYSAGIGGGYESTSGSVAISAPAIVEATGGGRGAGIGGGYHGVGALVTISGGTVTATGGASSSGGGAGIGGGYSNVAGFTTISGGTVTATGGRSGAGIGGGFASSTSGGTIQVDGGDVTATGGNNSAGIGNGSNATGDAGSISISDGATVTASGGNGASAIGRSNSSTSYVALTVSGELVVSSGSLDVSSSGSTTVTDTGILSGAGTIDGAGTIANHGAIRNETVTAPVTYNNHLATFDGAGDGATPATQSVRVYATTFADGDRELPSVTRVGDTFGGWWSEAGGAGSQQTATSALDDDPTVYAAWTDEHLVLTANHDSVVAGDEVTFTVTAFDAGDNLLGDRTADARFRTGETDTTSNTLTLTSAGPEVPVTAVIDGNESVSASTTIAVAPAALDTFSISPSDAGDVVAGGSLSFTVLAQDAYGNDLPDVAISGDAGTSCEGTSCEFDTVGGHTITATEPVSGETTSVSVNVVAGDLASLTLTADHHTILSGSDPGIVLHGFDAQGNELTDFAQESTTLYIDGVACGNITCVPDAVGTYAISASTGSDEGFVSTTEDLSLTVTVGPVATITVSAPDDAVAGEPIEFTVEGTDAAGNVEPSVAFNDATVSVDGADRVECDLLSCTIKDAGTFTATAHLGSIDSEPTEFTVAAASLASLSVSAPSDIVAGQWVDFTITGQDEFGNPTSADGSWIDFTSTTGSADSASCDGLGCLFTDAGSYTVTAHNGSLDSDATAFEVDPAQLASLEVQGPDTVIAGDVASFTVTAEDQYGNTVDAGATLSYESSDASGDCDGLDCSFLTAGDYTITANSGDITSDPITLTVSPAALDTDTFAITPSATGDLVAGDTRGFTVTAEDEFGNPLPDVTLAVDNGAFCEGSTCSFPTAGDTTVTATEPVSGETTSVTVTVVPGAVASLTLTADHTTFESGTDPGFAIAGFDALGNEVPDVAADASTTLYIDGTPCGNASCVPDVVGTYEITASTGTGEAFVESDPLEVTVTVGPVAALTVASPRGAVAGQPIALSLTGTDAAGNDEPSVALEDATVSIDGADRVECELLSCTIEDAGTFTATAHLGSVNSEPTEFTVTAASLASLSVTAPTDAFAGQSLDFAITGEDAFGNPTSADDSTITIAATTGDAASVSCGDDGCVITGAGGYTVTAHNGSIDSDATDFEVAPGQLSSVTLHGPSTVVAGDVASFTVTGADDYGNPVDAPATLSYESSDDWGDCDGLVCSFLTAGEYTVTATSDDITSDPIELSVTHADVASLTVTGPETGVAGSGLAYSVTATDEFGNDFTPAPGDGTHLHFATTDGDTDSVTCADDLSCTITAAGSYTVTARYDSVESDPITTVVGAAALHSLALTSPGPVVAGKSAAFALTGADVYGNAVDASALDDATLSFTTTDGDADTATSEGLDASFEKVGRYSVTASVGGVTSDPVVIDVTAAAAESLVVEGPPSAIAGDGIEFTVTGTDHFGNDADVAGATLSWATTDGAADSVVCDVLGCSITAVGTYEFEATLDGVTSSPFAVTVTPAALDTMSLYTPASAIAGATITSTVAGSDSFGNAVAVTDASISVESADGDTDSAQCPDLDCVITVAGSYTLTAHSGGVDSDRTTVVVGAAALHDLVLHPHADVDAGTTFTLTVSGSDVYGNAIAASDITGVTVTGADGCITLSCSITAAGDYELVAHADGVDSDPVALTVSHGALHTLTLAEPETAIAGEAVTATLTGADAYGNLFDPSELTAATFDFTTTGGDVDTATCDGLDCTFRNDGSYVVTAHLDGVDSSTSTVDVHPAALHTLTLSGAASAVAGTQLDFAATGTDRFGNTVTVDPSLSFTTVHGDTDSVVCGGITCTIANDGVYTVIAHDSDVDSDPIDIEITAGPVAHLTLDGPARLTAGAHATFTVTGTDQYENDADVAAATLQVDTSDGDPTSVSCSDLDCRITGAGSYTVTARDGSVGSEPSALTVLPAAAATVTLSADYHDAVAGDTTTFDSVAHDEFGNLVTDASTLTITGSGDGRCEGLSCVATVAGDYVVVAHNGTADSADLALHVTHAEESSLVLDAPATVTAGDAIAFSVSGADQYGNPIAASELTDSSLSFTTTGGDTDSITGSGLGRIITDDGSYFVVAHNGSAQSLARKLTVEPAALASLTLDVPAEVTAGEPFDATVTGTDAFDNTVKPAALDGATLDFGTTDGVAIDSLSATITTAGSYDVTASVGSITSDSSTVDVAAAALDTVTLDAPASVRAGAPFSFTVTGADTFGNPVDLGAVDLAYTTSEGSIDSIACEGLDCAIGTAGTYRVTAHSGGLDSAAITLVVRPSAIDTLVLRAPSPSTAIAGTPLTFTVSAADSHGNTVDQADLADVALDFSTDNGDAGSVTCDVLDCTITTAGTYSVSATAGGVTSEPVEVTLTPSDVASVTLSGSGTAVAGDTLDLGVSATDSHGNAATDEELAATTITATTADGDVATVDCSVIDCTITAAGTYELVAHNGTAQSDPLTVVVRAAALDSLDLGSAPEVTAGSAFTLAANGLDRFGNPVEPSQPELTFTTSDGSLTSVACTGLLCTVTNAGSYHVTVTDGSVTSPAITLTVLPAALAHLALVAPADATTDAALVFSLTGSDRYGNASPSVDLAGPTLTATTEDGDPASVECSDLECTITATGTYDVVARVGSISSPAASVTVGAGALAHLTLTGPADAVAGKHAAYAVTGTDAFGNPMVPTGVTLDVSNADAGSCAALDCTFLTAGTYGVTASSHGIDSDEVTTAVAAGAAAELVLDGPSSTTAAHRVAFTVAATDAFGNATSDFATVGLDVTPTGEAAVYSCEGLDCTFDTATDYSVVARAGSISSDPLKVTVAAGALDTFTLEPTDVTTIAGQNPELTVTATDAQGNPVDGTNVAFTPRDDVDSSNDCVADYPCAAGTYDIAVTNGDSEFDGVLHVLPDVAARTAISPTTATIVSGLSQHFSATATDRYGNTVAGTTLSISEADDFSGDASCDTDFDCTATVPGTYRVSAHNGEADAASATLTVVPAPDVVVGDGGDAPTDITVTPIDGGTISGHLSGTIPEGTVMEASMSSGTAGPFSWACVGPDDNGDWTCTLPAGDYPVGSYTLTVTAVKSGKAFAHSNNAITVEVVDSTATPTPTPTPTATSTPNPTDAPTPSPSATVDLTPSSTPTPSTPTPSAIATPKPTATPTVKPTATPTPTPSPTATRTPITWNFSIDSVDGKIRVGKPFVLRASGLPAGTTGSVWLHSDPIFLGTTTVGADGQFVLPVTIPDDVEAGDHHLVVTITEPGQDPTTLEQAVTVDPDDDPVATPTPTATPTPVATAAAGGAASGPLATTGGGKTALTPDELIREERNQPAAHTSLTTSVATVAQIVTNPVTLATAVGLALAIMLLVAVPTELLNSVLTSNTDRLGRGFQAFERGAERATAWFTRVTRTEVTAAAALVVISSIIFGFVDPHFGFDLASVRLVVSVSIAIFIVSYGVGWVTSRIVERWEVPTEMGMQPSALVFAVLGVIVARLLGFSPGFLIGLAIGLEIHGHASNRQKNRGTLVQFAVIVGVGVAAWIGYSVIGDVVGSGPGNFCTSFASDTLVSITSEGLTAAMVGLLPIGFLEGKEIYQRSKKLWVVLFLGVGTAFSLLVLPNSVTGQKVGDIVVWTSVLLGFFIVAMGAWLILRPKRGQEAAESEEHERVDAE